MFSWQENKLLQEKERAAERKASQQADLVTQVQRTLIVNLRRYCMAVGRIISEGVEAFGSGYR